MPISSFFVQGLDKLLLLWYTNLVDGALAQLGAHHTGSVGVTGSSPVCSTKQTEPRNDANALFLGFRFYKRFV